MPGVPLLPGCLKSGAFSVPARWSLWIVGRGQLLLQIPGGAAAGAAVRRRVAGSGPPPRAYAQPASAARAIPGGLPACGRFWGATVGAIGWSSVYPVRRGCRCGGHFVCPSRVKLRLHAALRRLWGAFCGAYSGCAPDTLQE
ncbi:Diacylglycerol acyltransferase family protein [Aspergillus niger]|uniref:Diacylglycerol acyltransferase family protein n=1 Tax=Aspergillus niger TaxID=5061 RepID=A0A505I1C2_ASPNG|nr:Diacylglycerol acyltransferase family protein [Aspergillus niger]